MVRNGKEDISDCVCPVCERVFVTPCSLHHHLGKAVSCSWYHFGKLKASTSHLLSTPWNNDYQVQDIVGSSTTLFDSQAESELHLSTSNFTVTSTTLLSRNEQDSDIPIEEIADDLENVIHPGDYEDLFHFIGPRDVSQPTPAPDIGEAGPGPNTMAYLT
jgi:hypothetical protein